jgi:hypothetical protein
LGSRELARTNPAERAAFRSPVPTPMTSNGEFNPLPQTQLGSRNWSTTFTVSLEGITDTQAAGIHEFCTTNRYRPRKRPAIPSTRLYRPSATNKPLKMLMILNVPPLPRPSQLSLRGARNRDHHKALAQSLTRIVSA